MRNHWTEIEKYLEDQKIAQELIGELRDFHMRYEVEDQVKERVEKPDIALADDAWQECMTDEQMEDIIQKYLSNLKKR